MQNQIKKNDRQKKTNQSTTKARMPVQKAIKRLTHTKEEITKRQTY